MPPISVFAAIRRSFLSLVGWVVPSAGKRRDATWWRGRVLGATLITFVGLAGLAIIPNVGLAAMLKVWPVVIVDLIAYGVLLWAFFARRASNTTRATALIAITWALGAYFTWGWGTRVGGPLWLLAAPILAAVLIGLRASVYTWTAVAVTVVGIGVLVVLEAVPWIGGTELGLPMPGEFGIWVLVGTNLLLLAGIGASTAAVLSEGLDQEVQARRSAERASAQLARAVGQSSDPVLLVDAAGKIHFMNAAASALATPRLRVGASVTELGLNVWCDPPQDSDEEFPWQHAISGRVWTGRCVHGVGEARRFFDGTLSPVRGEDGQVLNAFISLRDVTREEVLESRLRQAARLEAVGTLVGGVAHDFNNLLQPILANAEELKQALPKDHAGQPLVADIEQSAMRGRTLVRRVLTFSRGVTIERAPMSLSNVVQEALRMVRGSIPSTVTTTLDIHPDVWVLADAAELHHVVVNLVTNAVHAMPDGGELSVSVSREDVGCDADVGAVPPPADATAHFTVSDTGVGMDARTLERAFEPFFTTKGAGGGTGLGLSTVHGIVAALDGVVRPVSEPGRGTSMHVCLPLIEAPAESAAVVPLAVAEDANAPQHILLVDDEPAVERATRRLLGTRGFRVTSFNDPREALRAVEAEQESFDCVLSDLSMPHLDGVELAERIRDVAPHLPVVLVTGFVQHDVLDRADGAGVAHIMRKPYSSAELFEALATVTAARAGRVARRGAKG